MLQNVIAISLVIACVGFVAWQGYLVLAGRKSRIGSCCNKGCGTPEVKKTPEAATQFIPSSMLTIKSSAVRAKATTDAARN